MSTINSNATGIIETADNTNTLALQTGGTTAVYVDSSQNVGIGTSSPGYKLTLSGGGASFPNNYGIFLPDSSNANDGTHGGGINFASDNNFYLDAKNSTSNFIFRGTSYAERMRIDSSGNLLVGTTSVGGAGGFSLSPNSSAGAASVAFNRNATSSLSQVFDFRNGGTSSGGIFYNNTTTSYNTTSDYRLKENVIPLVNALDKIAQLKPSLYNYKAEPTIKIEGFIAHELQEVVPHAVVGEKDAVDADGNPIYQGVDASFLIPHLVAAVQELTAKLKSAGVAGF